MFWSVVLAMSSVWCHLCLGHRVSPGKCPHIPVKQDYDVHKYMGTWYGHASFGTESTQGQGRCVTARYSYNPVDKVVDIYNWQIPSQGYRSSINGTAVAMDPEKREGLLNVTFIVSENRTKTFPLMLLDTDYTSWAVVFYCKDLLNHHETSGWILTRTQDIENSVDSIRIEEEVSEVLKKANLSRSMYKKTVQDDCTLP